MTKEQRDKHAQTQKWVNFCRNKVDKIERTWNRKLEEPEEPSDGGSKSKSDQRDDKLSDDEDNGQIDIQRLLDKIAAKRPNVRDAPLSRSQSLVNHDNGGAELAGDISEGLANQGPKANEEGDSPK